MDDGRMMVYDVNHGMYPALVHDEERSWLAGDVFLGQDPDRVYPKGIPLRSDLPTVQRTNVISQSRGRGWRMG